MQDWMREFQVFMSEKSQIRSDKDEPSLQGESTKKEATASPCSKKLALGIARVSPTSVFSLVAAQLAGTSLEAGASLPGNLPTGTRSSSHNFAKLRRAMPPVLCFGSARKRKKSLKPIDPHELPVFEFQRPSAAETVGGSLLDLGLLIGFNVLFFAGAFVAFLRYDVR